MSDLWHQMIQTPLTRISELSRMWVTCFGGSEPLKRMAKHVSRSWVALHLVVWADRNHWWEWNTVTPWLLHPSRMFVAFKFSIICEPLTRMVECLNAHSACELFPYFCAGPNLWQNGWTHPGQHVSCFPVFDSEYIRAADKIHPASRFISCIWADQNCWQELLLIMHPARELLFSRSELLTEQIIYIILRM